MKDFRFVTFTALVITIFMNQLTYGAEEEITNTHQRLGTQIENQIGRMNEMQAVINDVYINLFDFMSIEFPKDQKDYSKMINESLQKMSPHRVGETFIPFEALKEYHKKASPD